MLKNFFYIGKKSYTVINFLFDIDLFITFNKNHSNFCKIEFSLLENFLLSRTTSELFRVAEGYLIRKYSILTYCSTMSFLIFTKQCCCFKGSKACERKKLQSALFIEFNKSETNLCLA